MNSDALHRLALDPIAATLPSLGLSPTDLDELNKVWHRMRAWEEFPAAQIQLRRRYPCFVMTVLSFSTAVDCSRFSGLTWDGIVSCEFLGHYKPDPTAYKKTATLLGLKTSEVLMVASHRFDLSAAQEAGMLTAYVHPKLNEPDLPGLPAQANPSFDLDVPNFATLAQRLSP
jgi:2-haloacid dehalogenase